METTKDNTGIVVGLYRNNGRENGNYYIIMGSVLGFYRKNGQENGNYYLGFRLYWKQNEADMPLGCGGVGFRASGSKFLGLGLGLGEFGVKHPKP